MSNSHLMVDGFNSQPLLLILIGGHLATAPRPQKEAAAARNSGFRVQIRGVWWDDRLAAEDLELANDIGVEFAPIIDLRRRDFSTLLLKVKQRLARQVFAYVGFETRRALGIGGPEMLNEALRIRPDLTMVHSEAGLWVGDQLSQRKFRVGVDFEDWFSEDLPLVERKVRPLRLLKSLERKLLREAKLTLTTTRAMAEALAVVAQTSRLPEVIPNCFPWKKAPHFVVDPKESRGSSALSFYWFSQTIGPGRGLENLAAALMQVTGDWELHLRGELRTHQLWYEAAFPLMIRDRVKLHCPVTNAELPLASASHDVGLALEEPHCPSRDLTATNKVFEYMRCGLAVIVTRTAGQEEVMSVCPGVGWLVPPSDVEALREALQSCIDNRELVKKAGECALIAASNQWAWESFEGKMADLLRRAAFDDAQSETLNSIS
jgi:glycosyltransferase involved in cell wall biosynthesis